MYEVQHELWWSGWSNCLEVEYKSCLRVDKMLTLPPDTSIVIQRMSEKTIHENIELFLTTLPFSLARCKQVTDSNWWINIIKMIHVQNIGDGLRAGSEFFPIETEYRNTPKLFYFFSQ